MSDVHRGSRLSDWGETVTIEQIAAASNAQIVYTYETPQVEFLHRLPRATTRDER